MLNMIFDTICTEAEPKSQYFKTEMKLNLEKKKYSKNFYQEC